MRSLSTAPALADAIGMQAAVIRHTEIDDIHLRSCTTPSSVVVCRLSLAHDLGEFDPEHVASAIWAGIELMTRLGAAVNGPNVLYRGVWPTYLAAPLGAAAVAARMWRLSEDATAHALSLALMLAAGRSGRFHGKLRAIAVAGDCRHRRHPRRGGRAARRPAIPTVDGFAARRAGLDADLVR